MESPTGLRSGNWAVRALNMLRKEEGEGGEGGRLSWSGGEGGRPGSSSSPPPIMGTWVGGPIGGGGGGLVSTDLVTVGGKGRRVEERKTGAGA